MGGDRLVRKVILPTAPLRNLCSNPFVTMARPPCQASSTTNTPPRPAATQPRHPHRRSKNSSGEKQRRRAAAVAAHPDADADDEEEEDEEEEEEDDEEGEREFLIGHLQNPLRHRSLLPSPTTLATLATLATATPLLPITGVGVGVEAKKTEMDAAALAVGAARAAVRVLDRTYKATGELDDGEGVTDDTRQRSPRGMVAAAEEDGSGSDDEDEEEGEEGGGDEEEEAAAMAAEASLIVALGGMGKCLVAMQRCTRAAQVCLTLYTGPFLDP